MNFSTRQLPAMPSEKDIDHAFLLKKIGAGDRGAFEELYYSVSGRLLSHAMRYMRRKDLAEDVLQESFLKIWRIASEYESSLSPPMAWMIMIVRGRSLEALRRKRNEKSVLIDGPDESDGDLPGSLATDPAAILEGRQQALELIDCISRLDERAQRIIYLAYFQDLDRPEIAKLLSMPLGSVKTFLRRGLIKLRECMAKDESARRAW